MSRNRIEAFSDGVFAIIITIMVLEFRVPHTSDWLALKDLLPVFFSYALSFMFVGIYWGNHHHLLHTATKVSSAIIWSNLNLLFWLSLIPFATGWMGENHFAQNPVIVYAVLLLMCGVAYSILRKAIEKHHNKESEISKALQKLRAKEYTSVISYSASIAFAFLDPHISGVIFLFVAILWIIPDKNIEKALTE
ncbi:MAG TPA: TMEM175 family protein [Chitinophagales bacterium]|nr:TMEM175 family protein [Chitinophagales bacterium]